MPSATDHIAYLADITLGMLANHREWRRSRHLPPHDPDNVLIDAWWEPVFQEEYGATVLAPRAKEPMWFPEHDPVRVVVDQLALTPCWFLVGLRCVFVPWSPPPIDAMGPLPSGCMVTGTYGPFNHLSVPIPAPRSI